MTLACEDGNSKLVEAVTVVDVDHSLTDSLTPCRLVNLIDTTLACEDGNSKLVEVVFVADVDDEDRVGNSTLQIWKLRFDHKAKLLFRFGQYFKVEVKARFLSWSLVSNLLPMFG